MNERRIFASAPCEHLECNIQSESAKALIVFRRRPFRGSPEYKVSHVQEEVWQDVHTGCHPCNAPCKLNLQLSCSCFPFEHNPAGFAHAVCQPRAFLAPARPRHESDRRSSPGQGVAEFSTGLYASVYLQIQVRVSCHTFGMLLMHRRRPGWNHWLELLTLLWTVAAGLRLLLTTCLLMQIFVCSTTTYDGFPFDMEPCCFDMRTLRFYSEGSTQFTEQKLGVTLHLPVMINLILIPYTTFICERHCAVL